MPHRHPGLAVLALAALPALALAPRRATAQPACTAIAGNLVVNCGFEGSTYIGSNGTYQPTGYTVTFQNGGNNSLQTAGFSRSGAASYVFGDRAPRSATLSQALATTPGAAYAITFYAFNSVDTDAGSYADNALTVMFGSVLLRTGPLLNGAYQQFTYTGIATSTSTTLAFTGSNTPASDFIDDLSVTAVAPASTVPEPGTWALLGTGLLAVGGVARRRRTATG